MRRLSALVISVCLMLALTSCGKTNDTPSPSAETAAAEQTNAEQQSPAPTSKPADETKEIVFWSLLGGGDGEILESMIAKYNESNPAYTVKHYVQDWGEYYNKLSLSVLSDTAPDVSISHVSRLMQLADQKVIEPLDTIKGNEKIDWNNFIDGAKEKVQVMGAPYSVPFDFHGFLLNYNPQVLMDAGVISSKDQVLSVKDFSDFTSILDKVKNLAVNTNSSKDDDINPLALQTDGDVPYKVWYNFYMQMGGDPLLSEDGSSVTMNDEKAGKALQSLLSLYNNGYAGVFNNQWEDFKAGKSAFVISFTSDVAAFNQALNGNMNVIAMPKFFDNDAAFADSHSFVFPVNSKRSDEKEASIVDFINWMVNSGEWMKTGHFPTTKSVYESPEYNALPFVQNYKDSVNNLMFVSGSKNTWLMNPPKTVENFAKIYQERQTITPEAGTTLIREGLESDK